jgi:hypothetical protein
MAARSISMRGQLKNFLGCMLLFSCASQTSETWKGGNRVYLWSSAIEGGEVRLRFEEDRIFFRLSEFTVASSSRELTYSLEKLKTIGCFFVNPEPGEFSFNRSRSGTEISIQGGDGAAAFSIHMALGESSALYCRVTGSDIRDPQIFTIQPTVNRVGP